MDSVFRCQFPTAAVKDDLRLVYNKADLDDAFKDKKFPDIKVELLFREAEGVVEGGEWVWFGVWLRGVIQYKGS